MRKNLAIIMTVFVFLSSYIGCEKIYGSRENRKPVNLSSPKVTTGIDNLKHEKSNQENGKYTYTRASGHAPNVNQKIAKRDINYYRKSVGQNQNAVTPLNIKTYDGSNQPVHPDIVYIDKGFHGYKYWMAYTPYPYSSAKYENPSIAASNDGINWTTPKGLRNPIVPPPSDVKEGGHLSDTDIIYDNGKLIVLCVYNKVGKLGPSKFCRTTSSDGVKWTNPEIFYQCKDPISGYSLAMVKENDLYKGWHISEGGELINISSKNGNDWSSPIRCKINIPGWMAWHVDVIKTDIGYEGLLCAIDKDIKNRALFYIKSSDGINWSSSALPVIYPSEKGWDSKYIYRATMIKQNGVYRIWYSACGPKWKWNIGYTEGKSMSALRGYGVKAPKAKPVKTKKI